MHLHCRSRQQRRGGNSRSSPQENLFHANSDAAPKKENNHCGKKEVTDANTISIRHCFTKKEKGFADTRGIAVAFPEKEKDLAAPGRGIALPKSEEEESFANSDANTFGASKEERLANTAAVRN